jgi:hypothetical protein
VWKNEGGRERERERETVVSARTRDGFYKGVDGATAGKCNESDKY